MKSVIYVLIFIAVTISPSFAECKRREVTCNGTCISIHDVCNSDKICAPNEFQCDKSRCVLKTWLCDSKKDCDDGSDEKNCSPSDLNAVCLSTEFACDQSRCVAKRSQCDSIKDCMDGSDERDCRSANITKLPKPQSLNTGDTLELTCEADGVPVPYISWRFNSGHLPAQCTTSTNNGIGKLTCPNIQPEQKGFYSCEAMVRNITTLAAKFTGVYVSTSYVSLFEDDACVLPDYPANGGYALAKYPSAHPQQIHIKPIFLNFTCNSGYKLIGLQSLYCNEGWWSGKPPKCISQCRLKKHPSIDYWCLAKGPLLSNENDQECEELVPDGATVRPECRKPNYHYTGGFIPSTRSHYDYGVLTLMHCVDETWNYVPTCSLKCGIVTSQGDPLVINGTSAKRGELPWHSAIYRKTTRPYEQICGGSLISHTIIISAAHCFWTDMEKQLPPEIYAVALGKLYRPWNDIHEVGAQKFNVQEIKIPPRFRGMLTNFQDDIALVILASAVVYSPQVLPVCIDFEINFERRQLNAGSFGKVAGWGLTAQDGLASPVLKVTALPVVDIDRCFSESPYSFQSYITSDKICAGYNNITGSAVCKGDSGGGLVFPSHERAEERYYLRGVVSTSPTSNHACNAFVYTTFTQVSRHQHFIEEYLN